MVFQIGLCGKPFMGLEWTSTNAPIEDEVVQASLRMNQKPILVPLSMDISTPSMSQNLPPSLHFPLTPSQVLNRALKLQVHRASWHKAWGRWKVQHCKNVESSTLQGREEEKERGVLHPKSRSGRKKGKLHPFFAFF